MTLLLGQLVYTSFANVGFRVLTSSGVPPEVKQAFVEQIVYRYWDSYRPPQAGYQAVYMLQVTPEQTLLGWLYNDGSDEFGRSHIPYFVCYYFSGPLQSQQLSVLFSLLGQGPVMVYERQQAPQNIEQIFVPEMTVYQPARPGIQIAFAMRQKSYRALSRQQLLDLAVSNDNTIALERAQPLLQELDSPLVLSTVIGGRRSNTQERFEVAPMDSLNRLQPANTEDYRQVLLRRLPTRPPQFTFNKPLLLTLAGVLGSIGLGTLIAATLLGSLLKSLSTAPSTTAPPTTVPPTVVPPPTVSDPPRTIPVRTAPTVVETPTRRLMGHTDAVWATVLSPDGKTLFSSGADHTIKVWDVTTGQLLFTLVGHSDTVRSLARSGDGRLIASASGDGTIKVWDWQNHRLIHSFETNQGSVWSVSLTQTGQTLISGGEDGLLEIWDVASGQLLNRIPAHSGRIFAVALDHDCHMIATAGIDQMIRIWDRKSGALVKTLSGHADAVRAVAFSPDGQYLASGSWDQTVRVWDWQTGKQLQIFSEHRGRVVAVAFGSDGKTLISGAIDNTVEVWNWQTKQKLKTLKGHLDWVMAVAASPEQIISGSKDGSIGVWENF
jgi:WD40 repeat protein